MNLGGVMSEDNFVVILCKRKMISSFDILSVSSFVFAAARPHEMFLRSNIFWSNSPECCWFDGQTCIQCSNSPLSLCSWSNPVFLFLCSNKMQAQYDNDMFICCRWEPDFICWLWYCCKLLITAASPVDVYPGAARPSLVNKQDKQEWPN